jgi:hypothetical protein
VFASTHPTDVFVADLIYASESRASAMMENPSLKITDLLRLMAERWKSMSESDKAVWAEKAAIDKKRYEDEMAAYKAKQ